MEFAAVVRAIFFHLPLMSFSSSRKLPARPLLFALFLSAVVPLHARLGETEAQSQQRYGAPTPELIGATDKPLLGGAKEVAYNFQGWRVRAAFIGGTTVRIEYVHLPENGALVPVTEAEIEAVLEGEKGKFSWKEEKPKMGDKNLNALKTMFDGRRWERSDHAQAGLKGKLLLTLETREVEAYEKKLAKPKGGATGGPGVPKF